MARNVEFINPDGLHNNPAFSQVAAIHGNAKTIYVGGQNSVSPSGEIIGKNDIASQAKQTFKNLEIALKASGASVSDVIKWNVYVVQGQSPQPAFEVFQQVWGNRPNPPLVTVLFVSGLANPEFLLEIEAIAVVSEK